MVAQVRYSVARRSRGRVALYAVYTVQVETRSIGFLVEPQNQGRRFVSGLASKPLVWFVSGLASKPLGRFVSGLASKLVGTVSPGLSSKSVASGFPIWASKPAGPVWCFGPQNHRDGFLVWASKPSGLRFVGCATKLMEGGRHGTHIEI
jgi:hypothetical protein